MATNEHVRGYGIAIVRDFVWKDTPVDTALSIGGRITA